MRQASSGRTSLTRTCARQSSPGQGRRALPSRALLYLRLVGPAVLAAIAASQTLVVTGPDGTRMLHLGVETLGVLACLGVVWWRRSLLLGILAAVVLVALLRAAGLG